MLAYLEKILILLYHLGGLLKYSHYSGEYVEELPDGGFILSGIIRYSSDNYEQSDIFGVWIVKNDAYGNMQWQNRLEGIIVHSIQLTSDGGYFVAGQMENDEIHLIKI